MVRANVISRILSAHGFQKSETYSTRIAGVNMWTSGYHVSTDYNDVVWITNRKKYRGDLNTYVTILASKGYTAEVVNDTTVKVTGKISK